MTPPVRYVRSGGQWIATTRWGEGDVRIVWISARISHVEYTWDIAPTRLLQEGLGQLGTVVQFDRRGAGLSDPVPGLVMATFDEWIDDLLAVMDAHSIDRATLFATLSATPYTLLFAAARPERVERIVLIEPSVPALDPQLTAEANARVLDLVEQRWGDGSFGAILSPQLMSSDPAARAMHARFERESIPRGAARAALSELMELDVRTVIPSVQAPVLILHGKGHLPVARQLLDALPDARDVEFEETDSHWWWLDANRRAIVAAVGEFITGRTPVIDTERVLAAVLFTDIVESTERLTSVGDAAWRSVLNEHDSATAEEIHRHRGRLVKSTGDGVLAVFDSPARAVRCGHAIQRRLRDIGLGVRAGVHAGEVELRGDDVGGVAVHVASRVMSLADNETVFVTRTVTELVAGSAIKFDARGSTALKGLPGEWEVFAAVEV